MKKLIFFGLLIIAVIFISGCINTTSSNEFSYIHYTSIKDLSQNPSAYVEQNITVRGNLIKRVGGYSLEDSEGYWIWLDDSCIEKQRDYNYGAIYSAEGTWLSPSDPWGFQYKLDCASPLV